MSSERLLFACCTIFSFFSGNENVGFHDDDIEGDFDPEKHDQRMRQLFDDDFYGENGEEIKPNFEFDPEIDEGKLFGQFLF